jgi:hypothetical protein
MAEHPCPKYGCDRLVPASKLACPEHWALVSKPTQQRVHQTWKARKQLRTIEAMRAHHRAITAAELEMNSAVGDGGGG